jgi:hypothetical protein
MKKKIFQFLTIDTPILVLLIVSAILGTVFVLCKYVFTIPGGWI